MPNSLRSKLKKLWHKGRISEEEYKELINKLAGHDHELLEGAFMNKLTKTVDVLRIRRTCFQRSQYCDKQCAACDLHLPPEEVTKAYNTAIALLDAQRNIEELMKGEK